MGSDARRAGTEIGWRRVEMSGLFLVLMLSGLMPFAALAPDTLLAPDPTHLTLDAPGLHLELDLEHAAPSQLDAMAQSLGRGIPIGNAWLGVDGQPGSPFVSNFLHAQEVRFTQIDPVAVASSLMIEVGFVWQ
jgi:hypothetical protein